ncbi:MAG: hypothetical protein QM674_13645 [Burkholderiaceae bacterium]
MPKHPVPKPCHQPHRLRRDPLRNPALCWGIVVPALLSGTAAECLASGSGKVARTAIGKAADEVGWRFTLDERHAALSLIEQGAEAWLIGRSTGSGRRPPGFTLTAVNGQGKTIALDGERRADGAYRYRLPTDRLGYFELRPATSDPARVVPAAGSRPAGMLSFAVLRPADPDPSRGFSEYFAALQGTVSLVDRPGPGWDAYPYLGMQSVGTRAYSWRDCGQTLTNKPDRSAECAQEWAHDALPDAYRSARMVPLFFMDGIPSTEVDALSRGDARALARYGDHLRAAATHIAARYDFVPQHFYQITWEPDLNWLGGDDALLAVYRQAHQSIHAADPRAIVIGPTMSSLSNVPLPAYSPIVKDVGAFDAFRRLMQAGLDKHLDAVSVHNYPNYHHTLRFRPELNAVAQDLRRLRTAIDALVGRALPLFCTEGGFPGSDEVTGPADPAERAYANVALALLTKSAGAAMHTYFYMSDFVTEPGYGIAFNTDAERYPNPLRTFEPRQIAPKLEFPMIRQVNEVTSHADALPPMQAPGGLEDLIALPFADRKTGVVTLAVWDPTNRDRIVDLKLDVPEMAIADAFGNTLTVRTDGGRLRLQTFRYPTYLVGVPARFIGR